MTKETLMPDDEMPGTSSFDIRASSFQPENT